MAIRRSAVVELVMETVGGRHANRSETLVETLLIRDGAFVARKYRYDGATQSGRVGGHSVEFHYNDGRLRSMVAVKEQRCRIAE